jgi:TRAP-type C4-dicarboxylate transport system permease small subunit
MNALTMIGKAFDLFEKILNALLRTLLGTIILVISYSVLMRYAFSRPPAWAEELSRFLFIWICMIGAILVTREESHIEFTIVFDRLPAKVKSFTKTVIRLLMLVFCWFLAREGIRIYPIVAEASSPTFGISMGWLYLSIPVGGILMGVFILEKLLRSVWSGEPSQTLQRS